MFDEFIDSSNKEAPVRGYLHHPAAAGAGCLILTHGAGASCQSLLLTALAEAFCAEGLTVLRCDLPFRQSRPYGPPPRGSAERDQQGLRAAVQSMRHRIGGSIFLGGHSYGGRQASILAANEPKLVDRLLLLSYPLHPPQKPMEMRTGHFPGLQTPAFFVSGMKDGFGSIAEIESAIKLIPVRTKLISVSGAGHELMTNRNRKEFIELLLPEFRFFTA